MEPKLATHLAMGWALQWWMAVRQQHSRILPGEPTVSLHGTRQVDAFQFVWALHNLRDTADLLTEVPEPWAHLQIREAIDAFDETVPAAKDLRNILSHVRDYVRGIGRLQKHSQPQPFNVYYSVGNDYRVHVSLGPGEPVLTIEVKSAHDAACELFRALGRALDGDANSIEATDESGESTEVSSSSPHADGTHLVHPPRSGAESSNTSSVTPAGR